MKRACAVWRMGSEFFKSDKLPYTCGLNMGSEAALDVIQLMDGFLLHALPLVMPSKVTTA